MADENENPDILEGEPYGTIEFEIDVGRPVNEKHTLDCNLATPLIDGLMDDYAEIFGVAGKTQIWYYNNRQLNGSDTLWESGLRCQDDVMSIKVKVI